MRRKKKAERLIAVQKILINSIAQLLSDRDDVLKTLPTIADLSQQLHLSGGLHYVIDELLPFIESVLYTITSGKHDEIDSRIDKHSLHKLISTVICSLM